MGPADDEHGLIPTSRTPNGMPGGTALSAALHLLLGGVFVFGLPTLFRPPPPKEVPIAVRLVTLASLTRATQPNRHLPRPEAKPILASGDVPAAKAKPQPVPPKPAPPPKAAQKPVPAPAKLAQTEPPPAARPQIKPMPPSPVTVPKPEAKPARALAHEQQRRKEAKTKRLVHVAKGQPRPAEKPKKKAEPKYDAAQFAALMRNLTPEQNAPSPDAPPAAKTTTQAVASSQPSAPLGSELTVSELDLVRRQIEQCWNIPAGARDKKDMVVRIEVSVGPDGNVEAAHILDRSRLAGDSVFRAAAESARRAFFDPQCRPLHLPPDKYALWKDLIVDFSPKDLL